MLKGYRILDRRARTGMGEIDLVVTKGKVVAMVEVKARSTLIACFAAITPEHRYRQARAAIAWIARHRWAKNYVVRFDIVAAVPGKLPRHILDAWRPAGDVLKGEK
jgi:putative endonuclease